MRAPPPRSLEELGPIASLQLWALLTAHSERIPVAPTVDLAIALLDDLGRSGIVGVPEPSHRWALAPDTRAAPIEGFQWRLTWDVYEPSRLGEALEDYFAEVAPQPLAGDAVTRLWQELGRAEAERFLASQLVRHRFPAEWAQDLGRAFARVQGLTIGQWRYCGWAAVRRGASLALQWQRVDELIRGPIFEELQKRAEGVSKGNWNNCSFVPRRAEPDTALSRGFAYGLTGLGEAFWTTPTTDSGLLGHMQPEVR